MKSCLITGMLAAALAVSAWAVAPPAGVPAPSIGDLIRLLGADTFEARQEASRHLEGREDALAALREATTSKDAEVRIRARRLVRSIQLQIAHRRLAEADSLFASGDVDQAVALQVEWSDYDPAGKFLEALFRLVRELIPAEARQHALATLDPEVAKQFTTVQGYLTAHRPQLLTSHRGLVLNHIHPLVGVVRVPSLEFRGMADHGAVSTSVIVADGEIKIGEHIANSVVLANGPVDARLILNSVIICDDAVEVRHGAIIKSIVIARGPVSCGCIKESSVFSGSTVTVEHGGNAFIRRKQSTFPGGVRFFDLERVGLDVAESKDGLVVRAVLPGKVLSSCPLRAHDIITSVGQEQVASERHFRRLIRKALVDHRKFTLTVKRGSELKTFEIAG